MEIEKFKEAQKLMSEIENLRKKLKDIEDGYWSNCEIILGTGYYSMNNEIKRSTKLSDEIGQKLGKAFENIVNERITELEKEFEAI